MKLCLAGTYCRKELLKEKKPKYILESFWSFKEWQTPLIKEAELFLLDSGAFSFMNNQKKGKKITLEEIYEYLDRYIEFINKYDIKYFFELDLDVIIGYNEVLKMRKILETKTNKKCIPVFHKNRGIQEWIIMCKNYDYVAIGTSGKNDSAWTRKNPNVIKKMVDIAKKYNCKVHGLGFTNINLMKKIHFYSVDSTSWSSGWRYGVITLFKDKKFKKIQRPKDTRMITEKGREVDRINYLSWLDFQEYADNCL